MNYHSLHHCLMNILSFSLSLSLPPNITEYRSCGPMVGWNLVISGWRWPSSTNQKFLDPTEGNSWFFFTNVSRTHVLLVHLSTQTTSPGPMFPGHMLPRQTGVHRSIRNCEADSERTRIFKHLDNLGISQSVVAFTKNGPNRNFWFYSWHYQNHLASPLFTDFTSGWVGGWSK